VAEGMTAAVLLRDVHKSLGGRPVLRGVSFSVPRGEIFGYLGPNGAGKTTTIRIILGLLRPDSGTVEVVGREDGKVGFVLENDGLFDGLTPEGNLGFYARLYGMRDWRRRARELLESVGLGGELRKRVGAFSRGMRQRLALARALLPDPVLLVLDEPTAGLDPTGQMELRTLIRELSLRGYTIFLSSHNLDEVQRLCHRIALIHQGRIRLEGRLEEIRRSMDSGEYVVRLPEPPAEGVLERIATAGFGLTKAEGKELHLVPKRDLSATELVGKLSELGITVEEVIRRRASLEEIYSRIVEEGG